MAALAALARQALARHPELQSVVLFGSLAKGDYGLYSDGDLLLVLARSDKTRYFDRIPDYLDDFLPAPIPVEVFPYTEEEVRRMAEAEGTLVHRALTEGKVLAERPDAESGACLGTDD